MAFFNIPSRCKSGLRAAIISLGALLQNGCATFSGHPEPVSDQEAEIREMVPIHSPTALVACISNPTDTCRNNIAAARMRAVDIRFTQFESRMFRQTREAGFGATLAALVFTSAATVTNGSARAFAAAAGLITAGREAFDKEMLAQQTVLAIHSAMRARRARIAARLATGLNLSVKAYSVNDLQRDLQAYEDAGNVLSALISVNEVVGDVAKKAETELEETISFKLDPNSRKIRNAVCVDERCTSLDKTRMQELLGCMTGAGVPAATLLPDFFFARQFSAERANVVQCMKL